MSYVRVYALRLGARTNIFDDLGMEIEYNLSHQQTIFSSGIAISHTKPGHFAPRITTCGVLGAKVMHVFQFQYHNLIKCVLIIRPKKYLQYYVF